jgi:hypothetical protein
MYTCLIFVIEYLFTVYWIAVRSYFVLYYYFFIVLLACIVNWILWYAVIFGCECVWLRLYFTLHDLTISLHSTEPIVLYAHRQNYRNYDSHG